MTESDARLENEIALAQEELGRAQQRLASLRRQVPPEPVRDYELEGPVGPVRISEIFGDRNDLILIHNMGAGCPFCTMWADEFNGALRHLESRAAFAVVSPDSPRVQQGLARKRGWHFDMYSAEGTTFFRDMGFQQGDGDQVSGYKPGVSVFHKGEDGAVVRVSKDAFGPGDLYCGVWHLFDLLADGPGDWSPQLEYSSSNG